MITPLIVAVLAVALVVLLFGPGTFLGTSRRTDGRRRANFVTSPVTGRRRGSRRRR